MSSRRKLDRIAPINCIRPLAFSLKLMIFNTESTIKLLLRQENPINAIRSARDPYVFRKRCINKEYSFQDMNSKLLKMRSLNSILNRDSLTRLLNVIIK